MAAAFVERELESRRGRKRAQLCIRVHAPSDEGDHWRCRHELLVDGKPWRPMAEAGGVDAMQALLLALGMVVFCLEEYEDRTGMTVDRWSFHDLWPLRGTTTLPGTRARAAAMRDLERQRAAVMRDVKRQRAAATKTLTREGSAVAPRGPGPRAKSARRKAPARRRSAPRRS